jgi:hypothetical protein
MSRHKKKGKNRWFNDVFIYSAAAGLMSTMASTCQQDSLTRCTDPLKVLTNNRDLGFAATKHELNSLCP